ncbi:MAG: iron ABC transporter permease [Brachymonas sp.]|nr:iron ABC transporter permease [Brachymonas sp.]
MVRRWAPVLLALLPTLFMLAMLLAPTLRLVWEGLWGQDLALGLPDEAALNGGEEASSIWSIWQDADLRWRMGWSLLQAAITCGLTLLLGVPLAWVLARWQFTGCAWVLRLLMLPFVVPTLVAALGVLALWGPRGWLGAPLLAAGVELEETPWLLLYGNLFFNLCLVVRAGVEALEQVSQTRLAAARTLGATAWRAFWRIEWPMMLPRLASSLCLVFLYCFSGFGLALVLGGQRYATVEVEIYRLVAHELALAQASRLALWTLGVNLLAALAYAWIEQNLASPARTVPLPRKPVQTWVQRSTLTLALLVLLAVCGAPLLAIVWRALQALDAGSMAVLQNEETISALRNTAVFASAAVVFATLLGVLHALAVHASRTTGWGKVAARAASFLPLVASPIMIAFGLLLLYPQWSASLVILLGAYTLLATPFVATALSAALDQLPASYAQAAATLGARPWRVFWRVTLPLILPALRRGMAFAAATALGEFAVSLFLSRPEWTTLTTLINTHLGRPGEAQLDAAMLLSALLMLLTLATFTLLEGRGSALPHTSHHSTQHRQTQDHSNIRSP